MSDIGSDSKNDGQHVYHHHEHETMNPYVRIILAVLVGAGFWGIGYGITQSAPQWIDPMSYILSVTLTSAAFFLVRRITWSSNPLTRSLHRLSHQVLEEEGAIRYLVELSRRWVGAVALIQGFLFAMVSYLAHQQLRGLLEQMFNPWIGAGAGALLAALIAAPAFFRPLRDALRGWKRGLRDGTSEA